jgi:hypothetical protein
MPLDVELDAAPEPEADAGNAAAPLTPPWACAGTVVLSVEAAAFA